jgi:hypothetical protein
VTVNFCPVDCVTRGAGQNAQTEPGVFYGQSRQGSGVYGISCNDHTVKHQAKLGSFFFPGPLT